MADNQTKTNSTALPRKAGTKFSESISLLGDSLFLKERKMPDFPCPECGERLDACTGISSSREGTIPTTAAVTVCAYCGTLLEFSEAGYAHAPRERIREVPDRIRSGIEQVIGVPVVAR